MNELIEILQSRLHDVREYIKAADTERGDLISRTDEISGKLRESEEDADRILRALKVLTGEDMKVAQTTGPRESTVGKIVGGVASLNDMTNTRPYFPGS